MQHIKDFEYKEREIIILKDTTTSLYAVDIRIDNFDGELIGGYSDLASEDEAAFIGMVYVDGMKQGARDIQHTIQKNYGV